MFLVFHVHFILSVACCFCHIHCWHVVPGQKRLANPTVEFTDGRYWMKLLYKLMQILASSGQLASECSMYLHMYILVCIMTLANGGAEED